MGAYTDDASAMTAGELQQALEKLAENWRAEPHLSNDGGESARYNELINALRVRFGLRVHIIAERDATDYQVRII
jgi:hypothetical protein